MASLPVLKDHPKGPIHPTSGIIAYNLKVVTSIETTPANVLPGISIFRYTQQESAGQRVYHEEPEFISSPASNTFIYSVNIDTSQIEDWNDSNLYIMQIDALCHGFRAIPSTIPVTRDEHTHYPIPGSSQLLPSVPDPISISANFLEIRYRIHTNNHTVIFVKDSQGIILRHLLDQSECAGYKRVFWDLVDDSHTHISNEEIQVEIISGSLDASGQVAILHESSGLASTPKIIMRLVSIDRLTHVGV